jgi:hypothetical protein
VEPYSSSCSSYVSNEDDYIVLATCSASSLCSYVRANEEARREMSDLAPAYDDDDEKECHHSKSVSSSVSPFWSPLSKNDDRWFFSH